MKYISFFSGIGGFEYALSQHECIAYSEIKQHAVSVYEQYFNHYNLGDISTISAETIEHIIRNGCDLIVAGFPCTNLSAIANISGDNRGLEGEQSSLFFDLLRIIQIIQNIYPDVHIILENNASMSGENRELITQYLTFLNRPIYVNMIDNQYFGVQIRKRIFWTTFEIYKPIQCSQTWHDILEPIEKVEEYTFSDERIQYLNKVVPSTLNTMYYFQKRNGGYQYNSVVCKYKTKIQKYPLHSDTCSYGDIYFPQSYPIGKSRPILTSGSFLIDRRRTPFMIRYFLPIEIERLFGFPDNWTNTLSKSNRYEVLANSVCIPVIIYIISHLK